MCGSRSASGATAAPVPLSVTTCGELAALSTTLTVPMHVPAAVGVKLTKIVQLAPAASVIPQVLVSEKSLALFPEIWTLAIVMETAVKLVKISACAPALVPTMVLAKVNELTVKPAEPEDTGADPPLPQPAVNAI